MRTAVRTAPAALPAVVRTPSLVAAVAGLVVVVVLGVGFAGDTAASAFDAPLLPGPDLLPDPWWYVATVVDFVGEPMGSAIVLVLFVGAALLARRVRTALLVLVGCGLTIAVTSLLKPLTGRTIHGGFLSYPSGHTAFATALALIGAFVLADRLGRAAALTVTAALAVACGALMAWTEVGLGAHYPTDTIGGFGAALAIIPATAYAVDRVADRL
ncbi:phosphatase PAP2 family protein [Amycolatopsis sp. FDAARGOS 1241]|uniref:phosphatase PAP2 family protein n=1 Tax=Amycolatopsis sp. FDAARGOS 1241 TaxID=2778070 RepID=UPI00194E38D6|nr:phosphatase PAP2 family protein [Amycolatopsis sp. FDAARGOS 1241]QRP45451.1 phosphatase PAP2 family protein [Amycolatopsis sp. FDAARGOS 1241]